MVVGSKWIVTEGFFESNQGWFSSKETCRQVFDDYFKLREYGLIYDFPAAGNIVKEGETYVIRDDFCDAGIIISRLSFTLVKE